MSRLMALNIVSAIQTWLISGALLAVAVGMLTAGRLGRDAGMPGGWWWLALTTVLLALVGVVLPLFDVARPTCPGHLAAR
jgi:uncharacterized membrane protein YhaH (DUF805 family)